MAEYSSAAISRASTVNKLEHGQPIRVSLAYGCLSRGVFFTAQCQSKLCLFTVLTGHVLKKDSRVSQLKICRLSPGHAICPQSSAAPSRRRPGSRLHRCLHSTRPPRLLSVAACPLSFLHPLVRRILLPRRTNRWLPHHLPRGHGSLGPSGEVCSYVHQRCPPSPASLCLLFIRVHNSHLLICVVCDVAACDLGGVLASGTAVLWLPHAASGGKCHST